MQAPTTPSGPPAQQPGERTCPACGAGNGPLAAFCWQCYRQFAGGPTASSPGGPNVSPYRPDGMSGLRGAAYAPAPLSSPFPQPKASRSLAGMLGVLSIVIVISAGVFVVRNQAPNASLPDSFGGLSRIRNAQIDQGVELFRSMAETEGVSADMGVYGVGAPSAALVWVTGVVAPSGDDFAEFADGFNTGLGTGSLDQSRRTSAVVGGVTYECAPVVGTPPGSVCMWEQDDVFWIVFELSGATVGAAQDLAVAAHDVVQA